MYKRILVPIDGSPTGTLGLREAIKFAQHEGSVLRVFTIVDEVVIAQNFEGLVNMDEMLDSLRTSGERAVAKGVAMVKKQKVKVEAGVVETLGSRIPELIVDEARKWKADLIVMGTWGRTGVERWVMGSDAEEVLRHTPVPILFVRSKASTKK